MIDVRRGDCLDVLRELDDESVSAIITDPPYGLSEIRAADVTEALMAWCTGDREHIPARLRVGFMSREWDRFVPPPAVWDECLRVLTPGGHLLAFSAPRTHDLMGMSIRLAGFEMRDEVHCSIGTLAWYFGSGFPKSKAVSRDPRFCQCVPTVRDAATEEAAESAAEVLLTDLRRGGKADVAEVADLHGVRVDLHPDYAVPGSTPEGVLGDVREHAHRDSEHGARSTPHSGGMEDAPAAGTARRDTPGGHGVGDVLRVRQGSREAAGVGEADGEPDLLASVQRQGAWAEPRTPCGQGPGGLDGAEPRVVPAKDERRAESRLVGGCDVQAAEGQLHRPEVRPLSPGTGDDGPRRRVHRGAPARDGAVDRPTADAHGVRQSHRPEPAEQRPVEPGAVPDERGPQARRGWPLCPGCGKPRLPAGLGTALKPAWEPIIVARKPLAGTVAVNVMAHGTGALNVDACRVGTSKSVPASPRRAPQGPAYGDLSKDPGTGSGWDPNVGRWPANVVLVHDGECVEGGPCEDGCPVAELDRQSGTLKSGAYSSGKRRDGQVYGRYRGENPGHGASEGGASRFFPTFRYQAKAPASERPKIDGKGWPTVKPLGLMRWLVRLVTPPDVDGRPGLIVDPFAGTGATLQAAQLEGFRALGIERDPFAYRLACQRLHRPDPETGAPPPSSTTASPEGDDPAELLLWP